MMMFLNICGAICVVKNVVVSNLEVLELDIVSNEGGVMQGL